MIKVLTLLILFFATDLEASTYTIQDLQHLSDAKSYEELLLHAKEVPPKDRSMVWFSLTREAITSLIDFYTEQGKIDRNGFLFVEKISAWPELREESSVISRRNSYGIAYLIKCIQQEKNQENCQNELTHFWTDGHQSSAVANELIKKVMSLYPLFDPWPLIVKVTKDPKMGESCSHELIKKNILIKLSQLDLTAASSFDKEYLTIASKECLKEIESDLQESLKDYQNENFIVSYLTLSSLGRLNEEGHMNFSFLYLMTAPPKGELHNLAWNRVSSLKEKYKERQELLNSLIKLDPLPDLAFSKLELDKRKILVTELSKSFPEYLDHYFKTCVKFYQGKGNFINGNPTVNCREFYKAIKGTRILNEGLQS